MFLGNGVSLNMLDMRVDHPGASSAHRVRPFTSSGLSLHSCRIRLVGDIEVDSDENVLCLTGPVPDFDMLRENMGMIDFFC